MDKKNMFSLEGKIALVTGGAHGIGFAIAESYAEAGATVVFNCSSEASLERGLAAYKEKGIDAHGYVCDVTDEAAVREMIDDIEKTVAPLDILVNNFGSTDVKTDLDVVNGPSEDFFRIVNTNLKSVYLPSKAAVPLMAKNGGGSIINIGSVAAV